MINPERSVGTRSAIRQLRSAISAMGLCAEVTSTGEHVRSLKCELRDNEGNIVARSAGKGEGEQALASALGESFEHYTSSWAFLSDNRAPAMGRVTTADVLAQAQFEDDLLMSWWAGSGCDHVLEVLRFDDFVGDDSVLFPTALLVPDLWSSADGALLRRDVGFLEKYSSNSGTASGMTLADATLHALAEVVERDLWSTALIQTIWRQSGDVLVEQLRAPDVPFELRALWLDVEEVSRGRVEVLRITAKGVSAFVATAPDRLSCPLTGSGCSLSDEYGLERALRELAQVTHLNDDALLIEYSDHVVATLSKSRPHTTAARLRLEDGSWLFSGVPRAAWNTRVVPGTSELQVEKFCRLLGGRAMTPYVTELYKSPHGPVTVAVLVPGAERFHGSRDGMVLAPCGRVGSSLVAVTR